jgi:biotin operon repressor
LSAATSDPTGRRALSRSLNMSRDAIVGDIVALVRAGRFTVKAVTLSGQHA